VKILVVEDHQLIREMLVVTCGQLAVGAQVAGASTGAEGVRLCRELQPDLLFLDLALPDGDGLDFLPQLFSACYSAKVIALTSHADEFTLHRALRAHVHGFVDKNEQPLKVLREAIATVMEGRPYFSSAAQRLRAAMRNDPAEFIKVLSEREQQLLALMGAGLTNEDIGAKIGLSAGTVKNHRLNIMNKLDLHSTPELMRYAVEKGLTRSERSLHAVGRTPHPR
jgi:two-component system response regulator NreC